MPRPRYCRNPACSNARQPRPGWLWRSGFYRTQAHGRVQRFVCKGCGKYMGAQTESMHYYAKRRLDLEELLSRLRGGSSMRDIARELGCSRTAVANAVLRLGRQAMGAQVALTAGLGLSGRFVFDGLLSALCSRDWPSQITTLVDGASELLLAMTHWVGVRGGRRTAAQHRRMRARSAAWEPRSGGLKQSIGLLVNELARFAEGRRIHIDTDENPLYTAVISADLAMRWHARLGRLTVRQTSSRAPRTTANALFAVNYLDRMIRHRLKEHTRESIALGRNATMQMHRLWIFAWDHNCRQPYRVKHPESLPRAIHAGASPRLVRRLSREFMSRRISLRGLAVPESIRQVWLAELDSPPLRWRAGKVTTGPPIRDYARLDLAFASLHPA